MAENIYFDRLTTLLKYDSDGESERKSQRSSFNVSLNCSFINRIHYSVLHLQTTSPPVST